MLVYQRVHVLSIWGNHGDIMRIFCRIAGYIEAKGNLGLVVE